MNILIWIRGILGVFNILKWFNKEEKPCKDCEKLKLRVEALEIRYEKLYEMYVKEHGHPEDENVD